MVESATSSREIKFIAVFILIASFFGLSEQTANFFFPDIGSQVFKTINFYFIIIIAFLALNYRYVATIPSVFSITIRYIISFPIFYLFFMILFGNIEAIPIPRIDNIILETIISFSENLLVLYLIPPVWYIGTYLKVSNINTLLNNVRFHIPAIVVITLLHSGVYSLGVSSFNEFYLRVIIVFFMFTMFVIIKELLGFGTSEAAHAGYNTALLSVRGAII